MEHGIVQMNWNVSMLGGKCFGSYKKRSHKVTFDFSVETKFEQNYYAFEKFEREFDKNFSVTICDAFNEPIPYVLVEVTDGDVTFSDITSKKGELKLTIETNDIEIKVKPTEEYLDYYLKLNSLEKNNIHINLGYKESLYNGKKTIIKKYSELEEVD